MFRVTWPADNKLVALDDQDRMRLAEGPFLLPVQSILKFY